jgi:hypothetical protein
VARWIDLTNDRRQFVDEDLPPLRNELYEFYVRQQDFEVLLHVNRDALLQKPQCHEEYAAG